MDQTIFDKVHDIDLQKTMETSYIDYAMSVIAARALPDVRDGLKPVQRRILYSMIELNNGPDKPHRKCARIVGDTMGKYHPHGDSSIYEALVKLAQDFNTRYPLVDGHGNFGSVDGDGAAAMRYTEARLSKISMEMLSDINKDTVDFVPNFDDTEKEPSVLPSRYPNLLVNGTTGIAVGMATNIPPHNLRETINAVVKIIDNQVEEERETSVDELMDIVKGPDFPTGGEIMGKSGIDEAYRTGRGKIRVRAVADIETMPNGKSRIIVTEIPYMVNKARLIEKIADLVKDKKLDGITDLRDESDRTGMRICIELRRDVNANVMLNKLYKHTQMMDTFGVIMLALVDNEPRVLNLKDMLGYYLEHQKEVVTRRTRYELNKAEERAHILQGLLIALDHIDEVISIIRASRNTQEAKRNLIERFEFSDAQAQAIVDMRLRALTGLEREKLEGEYRELMAQIEKLKAILADEKKLLMVIRGEITAIRDKYGDERRTAISMDAADLNNEDLIPDESVVITMTNLGYIKRMSSDTFRAQHRGGKGIKGMQTVDQDVIEELILTRTHRYLLFFTNKGRVYRMKTYEIPEAGRTARGTAIVNILQLQPEEKITAVIPLKEFEAGKYIFMCTKYGMVKKTPMEDFRNIRKTGLQAINMRENDDLIEVKYTDGDRELVLVSRSGMCIRFNENDVRPTGRNSMGVRGMDLQEGDELIGMQMDSQGEYLLLATSLGMGKKTRMNEFKAQNRGGKGVKCYKINEKTGDIVGAKAVNDGQELMIVTTGGIIIRISIDGISTLGRVASGVKLIDVDEEKTGLVASIAKVKNEEAEKNSLENDSEEEDAEEFTEGDAEIDEISDIDNIDEINENDS
ncbi:MAG: DNA gyrase subunit A, partial [Lachnospiraceae bacterium]|nr:DNA gyrase subunit A [Lachnospiraceae bacterium]